MAQRVTDDEFQRELTNSGLGSEFSAADLKLAQQNPDAGMSILKYKRDYHNATTPEQRALPVRLPRRLASAPRAWIVSCP